MLRKRPMGTEAFRAYATSAEFCGVFAENMDNMHLLSFLLTADLTRAEECFVSGLEDCVDRSYVFRDWARSWARRTIIQNAIRMLAPRPSQPAVGEECREILNCRLGQTPEAHNSFASILALETFERFVFVMSVLERYSDQDCSVLLGRSRQEIGEARMRALLHVAESDRLRTIPSSACGPVDPQAKTRETQLEPQF